MNERTPTQEDIDMRLAALQAAWDWLMEHGVVLRQTNSLQWVIEKRIILTIGTNTPVVLVEALKRHRVVIEEREGASLFVFFPEGTKRMPQLDLPGTFLLILPDGWSVQELPLPQGYLTYSSVLVAASQEEPAPTDVVPVWVVGNPEDKFV